MSPWMPGWIRRNSSSAASNRELGQPDAMNHFRETRVPMKVIEGWIDLQIHQGDRAVVERFLQPVEGLVLVAEAGVDRRDPHGLYVGLLGSLLQIVDNLAGICFPVRNRVILAEASQFLGSLSGDFQRLLE